MSHYRKDTDPTPKTDQETTLREKIWVYGGPLLFIPGTLFLITVGSNGLTAAFFCSIIAMLIGLSGATAYQEEYPRVSSLLLGKAVLSFIIFLGIIVYNGQKEETKDPDALQIWLGPDRAELYEDIEIYKSIVNDQTEEIKDLRTKVLHFDEGCRYRVSQPHIRGLPNENYNKH